MTPGARSAPWRLLRGDGSGRDAIDGPTNMAIDGALLDAVKSGSAPAVRLYRWDPPTLSFGRNQPALSLYDLDAAAARGIAFVRRPTGGQAVLHDDELTYAVVAPVAVIGRPRAAYRLINEGLVEALRRLGVPARLAGPGGEGRVAARGAGRVAPDGGAGDRWAAACFRRPEDGEVVVGGRKLVGSAQRTEGRVILQHGSILVGGSQAAAEDLRTEPPPGGAADGGWTTLEESLGRRPGPGELEGAVAAGLASALGTTLAPAGLSTDEAEAARRLRARFGSDAWTWRR